MRRLLSATFVTTAVAGFLAVPVVGVPVAQAHPVRATVVSLPTRTPTRHGPATVLTRVHTRAFSLVGATWRRGTLDPGTTRLQVRVHQHGHWSGWQDLGAEDGGADGGTPDGRRAAATVGANRVASPLWVGPSDGVEARVVGPPATHAPQALPSAPAALRVVLVDGGSSAADADPRPVTVTGGSVAAAAESQPTIFTRSDWGADESLRRHACPAGPDYAPGIVMGFIHHTDNANGYSRAAVPGIIRSIYAYHVNSNGWCDVGYNFLVDRFGRIWEGRYGGITKAVVGAHTGGFNTDSFGVSLIGTFTSHAPSSAMLRAVDKLFAWKLGTAYRDPRGKSQLTAGSFSGSRFAAGRTVTFDTVSGHRDADFTDCPGGAAYRDLPSIRNAIAARMGAGFVSPALSTASVMMAGPPVTVSAHVVGTQTWTLTVRDSHGTVVASVPGTAKRSSPVAASWDLTDNGVPVPPGSYALELTGADAAGDSAVPWQASLDVTPPVALTAPSQVALGQPVSVRGRGVPGHHVTVDVTGPGGSVRGTFPVGSDGRWRTTSPVSATGDLDWTVTDTAITGYSRRRTTRVAPAIASPTSSPVLVAAGSAVQVKGSALPSAGPLRLVTQHPGGSPAVTGAAIPVASDGSWSTSFTPTGPTTFWTTDSRGLTSIRRDAYSVSAPAASAPATGYAGRSVRVAGDAGGAPVAVTLRRRLPGGSWTDVRTVTAATDGHFTMQLPLPAAAGGTAATPVRWGIVTSYGAPVTGQVSVQPVFPPTVTGPARVSWNVIALLTGTGVPGDHVIVWTAPAGSSGWVRQGRVTAASDKSWSFALPVTADTAWRVSSPSGTSASGVTVVVPTLHVPSSVASGTRVTFRGRAIPGQTVTLERRLSGATAWTVVRRTTATSNGTWSLRRTVRNAAGYRAVSHGQQSHTRVVSVS